MVFARTSAILTIRIHDLVGPSATSTFILCAAPCRRQTIARVRDGSPEHCASLEGEACDASIGADGHEIMRFKTVSLQSDPIPVIPVGIEIVSNLRREPPKPSVSADRSMCATGVNGP
jgi:hypothetical protein